MSLRFTDLQVGSRAKVINTAQVEESYRKKLIHMGLIPGTVFEVVRVAPLGDPMEIQLRAFSLSLRRAEAANIEVELL